MAETKGSGSSKKITVTEKKTAPKSSTGGSSSAKKPAAPVASQKTTSVATKKPSAPVVSQKPTSAASKKPSAGGKTAKAPQNARKPVNITPPEDRIGNKILPFVWFVLALFFFFCFILRDLFGFRGVDENLLGPIGEWIHIILFGLFGWAAYLIVAAFVYLGIMWRRLISEHRIVIKLIFGGIIFLLTSALGQVFVSETEYPGVDGLWENGNNLIGGGVIGGSLGWLSYAGLKLVGSSILLIAAIFVIVLLFFDLTPHNIMITYRARRKLKAERRAEEEYVRRVAAVEQPTETNYTRYRREHGEPDEKTVPTLEEPPAKTVGKLKLVKRSKNDDEDFYDDGFFDMKPEDGAILVDGEVAEKPEEKAEEMTEKTVKAPVEEPVMPEAAPVETTDSTSSFKLESVFAEHRMLANDEDDSIPSLPIETETVSVPDSAEPDKPKWTPPPIDLLVEEKVTNKADMTEAINVTKRKLRETLESFDIRIKDIGYSIGPSITRYEVIPEAGVRVRAIANLVDDIAMNLATVGVRIEAPIPNKPAVGVEVPNTVQATVHLRSLIDTDTFRNSSPLTVCLGQDVAGKNVFFDIKKMPHMIIAGTTGSGKSVCINCIVCSLLYKNPPDKVKLIMVDPKKVEFSIYQHIPHLYCPIISDPRKAAGALASAVAEMERRYTLIEDVGVRDIDSYNQATARDPDREYLPKLIIVIDELADLMMMAKADVELFITRIAQKARAVGIHLIIGTQRPSVDVITGLIKANVPSRIACTVKSQVDSRTIIDIAGAEKLIGRGDMLFSPVGLAKPMRVQGAFLEDAEVARVIDFIKANNAPVEYNTAFMDSMEAAAASVGEKKGGGGAVAELPDTDENGDAKFRQAVQVALDEGKISTSLLQRKLEIGYGRAAKLIDRMEELGYVSEPDGNKPRRILITKQEFYEKVVNNEVTASGDDE